MKLYCRFRIILLSLATNVIALFGSLMAERLVVQHLVSPTIVLVIFGLLAGCAVSAAIAEQSARECMERQMIEERRELLTQIHHYADEVLGTLLSRALSCPTQYYAHRISEALDHIESMVHTAISQWKLDKHQPEPHPPPPKSLRPCLSFGRKRLV